MQQILELQIDFPLEVAVVHNDRNVKRTFQQGAHCSQSLSEEKTERVRGTLKQKQGLLLQHKASMWAGCTNKENAVENGTMTELNG